MLPEERSAEYSFNYIYYAYTCFIVPTVFYILSFVISTGTEMKALYKYIYDMSSTRIASSPSQKREDQFILVTGCDRGFGFEIAKNLDAEGYSVLAGCLQEPSMKQLQDECSERLKAVKLDVTSSEDLDNVYNWLKGNMGNRELRGVVNNAGICFMGTPEIMATSDISKIIDVNFHGTVNVTRKFLPLIRQSKGRIVNIGSLNGEVPMPFFSIYNATKAAVKMFSESLAYEVKDWGVKVSLVAPASFKTGIMMYDRKAQANKWWNEATDEVRDDYGQEFFSMPMRVSGRMTVSADLSPVLTSVMDALTAYNPKPVYRVGSGAIYLPTICHYTPNIFKSYICGSYLNFISILPKQLRCNQ